MVSTSVKQPKLFGGMAADTSASFAKQLQG